MPKDTFYPQLCRCTNPECAVENKFYLWKNSVDTFTIPCVLCDSPMLPVFDENTTNFPAIIGLRNDKNLAQRKVRNHNHFKKEVFPTLSDTVAKKHFSKKLGIKL